MPFLDSKRAVLAGAIALALLLGAAGFRPDGLTWIPATVYSDSPTSHYPAALYLHESVLENGEFPLWRDWFMAGAPFAANPLNKTAYPLQWVGLLFDSVLFLNGMVVLHLSLAGWGMWRWSRQLGLGREGALVSALAWMLAPRLLTGLGAGHLDLIYAAAWWPWLLAAAMHLGQRASGPVGVWCALFAALLIQADVRLALYALPSAAITFGIAWWRNGRLRWTLAQGLVSVALVAGLALAVILPLAGWSVWMNRGTQIATEAAAYSLDAGNLFGLLFPLSTYTFETLTYLGLTTLILTLIGVWKLPKPWRWALLAGFVLIVLWALGPNAPLWPALVGRGGLLSWFRVPARIWYLVALIAAPLAGLGMEALLNAQPRSGSAQPSAFRWVRLGVFGLLVALTLMGIFLMTVPLTTANGLQVLVTGLLVGTVLLLVLAGRLRGCRLYWAFVALLLTDAALGARAWVEWRPLQPWLDSFGALTGFLRDDQAARVYSPDYSLPQEAAASAGIRLFGGVDPFQIAGVTDAVLLAGGISYDGYSVVVPPLLTSDAAEGFNRQALPDANLLAEWGVSHVIAGFPIEAVGLDLADTINGVYVYRNIEPGPGQLTGSIPDWPEGWPGLPDADTVAGLNQQTQAAWQVSMALMIILLVLLAGRQALNRWSRRR